MSASRVIVAVAATTCLLLAACGGSGDSADTADRDEVPADEGPDVAGADDLSDDEADERVDDYLAEAADVPEAETDAAVPAGLGTEAGGSPGFSRYVFRSYEDQVLPSLVEGPQGQQTRCQDPELPCSYLELKELHESGDEIPDELNMSEEELAELVDQLNTLNGVVNDYRDVNKACADGYRSDRTQTPNMGSHFYHPLAIADGKADPEFPDILLYARTNDENPGGPLGQCINGTWEGGPVEMVGTSYLLPQAQVGDDHPEAFAGELDNWHIHYNLCRGLGRDTIVPRSVCEREGGSYNATLGWMIHAWVDENHDNELGVFSMWNPSIWPVSDPEDVVATHEVTPPDLPEGGEYSPINNFQFEDEITVEAGDPVVFGNSDSVAHTVTDEESDEDPAFDSGVVAPGDNTELSFDEPGQYRYYCALHPDMQGIINVE